MQKATTKSGIIIIIIIIWKISWFARYVVTYDIFL